jgi:hypothetical protein
MTAGLALLLGWLYAKPQVASAWPNDEHGYGFGGLRPRLIRAGGGDGAGETAPVDSHPGIRAPEYVPEQRTDGAEPPRLVPVSPTSPTSPIPGEAPR